MVHSVAIRAFAPGDHEAAKQLWLNTPGVGLSEADGEAEIHAFLRRNPGTNFVAIKGQHLVGTILCGHDGRRGLIHHLVVAPEVRRMGLGRKLLVQGLSALHLQGIGKCHLLVFKSNAEGLAFWHSVGAIPREELGLLSMATQNDG